MKIHGTHLDFEKFGLKQQSERASSNNGNRDRQKSTRQNQVYADHCQDNQAHQDKLQIPRYLLQEMN
ncbi:575_t:CDS:2 [Racocetra fulgida]|uniref:575_t:CDS:1 n=1 Tax=Racocetra fulgida TaxID=60492 RepID=A0A9N8W9A3_9GLOM|nr:575_t:CDS:2 [Racocetra fulgida]